MPEAVTPPPASLEVVYDEGGKVQKEPTERRRRQWREGHKAERVRLNGPVLTDEELRTYVAIANGGAYEPKDPDRGDNGESCCRMMALFRDVCLRSGLYGLDYLDGADCCHLRNEMEFLARLGRSGALRD